MRLKLSSGSYKLENIYSLNTFPYSIPFCYKQFCNKNSICHYCYSVYSLYSFRTACIPIFENNTKILSKALKDVPIYNHAYIRINSHGELINKTHFNNIIKICNVNKWCKFSLFTKRLDIIQSYNKRIPSNLILVYSNNKIDKPLYKIPSKFHKVFSVIDKNKHTINCKQKCIECLQCYSRTGSKYIVERIKNYSKNVDTARQRVMALFTVYQ